MLSRTSIRPRSTSSNKNFKVLSPICSPRISFKQDSIEIAKITSSIQLSAQQQKEIAEKLKVITGAKQIKLALKVDPALIGGFTIEIWSKMIDTSIRGQLKQISALLGA